MTNSPPHSSTAFTLCTTRCPVPSCCQLDGSLGAQRFCLIFQATFNRNNILHLFYRPQYTEFNTALSTQQTSDTYLLNIHEITHQSINLTVKETQPSASLPLEAALSYGSQRRWRCGPAARDQDDWQEGFQKTRIAQEEVASPESALNSQSKRTAPGVPQLKRAMKSTPAPVLCLRKVMCC